jgi:hypothetical protein
MGLKKMVCAAAFFCSTPKKASAWRPGRSRAPTRLPLLPHQADGEELIRRTPPVLRRHRAVRHAAEQMKNGDIFSAKGAVSAVLGELREQHGSVSSSSSVR